MGDNLFTRFYRFLSGYVTVTVEGFFLEKFTNLCVINCLPFWNVRKYGTAKIVGQTTIKGFKQMRFMAKKCGCRVSLDKKKGTPFILHRYRKRKIFVVGLILFFVCIKVASMFVWRVEVLGNETVNKDEILYQANELGIKKWVLKDRLDINKLANELMIKREDLSWVGIDVDGIKVNIKIVEKAKVPDKIDENVACNIIAKKPALIVGIDTYQGTAMVKVGDIVDKDAILVSGVIEMKQFPDKTQFVHALANIKAKVWYEETKSFNFSKLRPNEQMEEFAYKLAYESLIKKIPSGAEILNVSKSVSYTNGKVMVTVVIETIEDIGLEVEI